VIQPTLVGARVIAVETYRKFVEMAYEGTRMFDRDRSNAAMPPRCTLIESPYQCKDYPDIREDEINLIVELDGLIAYDLDGIYILGVTIGYYAMPVLRRKDAGRWRPDRNCRIAHGIYTCSSAEDEYKGTR
jgi:hypothetical protein